MACVSRESILAAAHAVGTELPNEIAEELARDVGYRMKEIIQASTEALIDLVCAVFFFCRKKLKQDEKNCGAHVNRFASLSESIADHRTLQSL